jgi:hypothetical protein
MRILFRSGDACIKYASFVVCCQATAFAVHRHRQYTTCTYTITKMRKLFRKSYFLQ